MNVEVESPPGDNGEGTILDNDNTTFPTTTTHAPLSTMNTFGRPVPGWMSEDVFAHFDYIDTADEYRDDPEETAAFEEMVRREVELKLGHRAAPRSSSPLAAPSPLILVAATPLLPNPPHLHSSPPRGSPGIPSGLAAIDTLALSPSAGLTSTHRSASTPLRMPWTAPTVETPDLTAVLPPPPATLRPRLLDTPTYVPTPQTPDATDPTAIARGRRDDPATPVPLGSAAKLKQIRSKSNFQTLTKQLETLNKQMSRAQLVSTRSRERRGPRIGLTPSWKIGCDALKGTRICLLPESIAKGRIDIVSVTASSFFVDG